MARVSISEAARLAGIARSNFYTTYIKKGRISVSVDGKGKKFIDTSELLRVFPDIKQDSGTVQQDKPKTGQSVQDRTADQDTVQANDPDHSAEIKLLKSKLAASEAQVSELQSDKQWLQSQVTNLTDSIKLLEAPKYHRRWWQFWE